ncbi:hypothetical protein [Pseudonocardia sp. TRM90224]|uniref:hypothetical protein n=1 Tax=Pseudonocardia sp. TRM90224 TaxID=2812678 RepID=UPI001E2AD571|nr:hypothetical protein [Pseudonocardia sp. TRM90224]
MLAQQLTAMQGAPAGIDDAAELAAGFDDALVDGLARLGEEHAAAVTALAAAFAGSPLGERVAAAAAAVTAGSPSDADLVALAGARTALFGSVHDALLGTLDSALGRDRTSWPAELSPAPGRPGAALAWLRELAISGWRGVDDGLLSTAEPVIEALLTAPGRRRLAVLLDGFAGELRAGSPLATMARLPTRRWADLWCRAVLLDAAGTVGTPEPVSGRLLVLGVDVAEHATAVQVQVHGVLEPSDGGQAVLVRAAVTAAKVETITGPAVWALLRRHPVLLGVLAGRASVEVSGMPMLPGGELLWDDGCVAVGEAADPFVTARLHLAGARGAAVAPIDRHPVAIAEPVVLEGYRAVEGGFDLGGATIAVDTSRLPSCGPLTPALVKGSTACIGLLRHSADGWQLQPLAVQAKVKRALTVLSTADWALGPTDPAVQKAQAKAGDAVGVLQERAGRLLRK